MKTEEYIKRACETHKNFFDYSKTNFTKMKAKINIICPEHGEFTTVAGNHLYGTGGCSECNLAKKTLRNFNIFLNIAKKKYDCDYSKSDYKNTKTLINIICPEHGEFQQKPERHLEIGCPECRKNTKVDLNLIIKECDKVYDLKYDFSNSNFKTFGDIIEVICPTHGKFKQRPNKLVVGKGCPKCLEEGRIKENKRNFVEIASKIFNNYYSYDKVEYKDIKTKIIVTCPVHGDFEIMTNNHLNRHGCQKCGINKRKYSTKEYIEESIKKHKGYYSYDKVEYKGSGHKIIVTCPVHGDFEVNAGSHLFGTGCLKCSKEKNGILKYKGKITYLYYIYFPQYDLYKIGLTRKSVENRFAHEIKDGLEIEILKVQEYKDGAQAFVLEQAILQKHKDKIIKKKLNKILITGNTEIFTEDVLNLKEMDGIN